MLEEKGQQQELERSAMPQAGTALNMLKRWLYAKQLKANDCLPSERVLADELGIPRYNARVAIKILEEQGWFRRVGRKRFINRLSDVHPAHTAAMDSVLILNEPHYVNQWQIGSGGLWCIDAGADQMLSQKGITRLAMDPASLSEERVEQLIAEQPRGIITFRDRYIHKPDIEKLRRFKNSGIPVVLYGYGSETAEFDSVESDQQRGTYLLTQALINRGCRRILRYWERRIDYEQRPAWLNDRDLGYEQAMHDAGLEPLPALRCYEVPFLVNNREKFIVRVRATAGYLIDALKQDPPVDAIIVISDGMTFTVAGALRIFGIEPNVDIAVAGYDNYWMNAAERTWEPAVPMATVDKRNLEIGKELARLLLDRINGTLPDQPEHRKVEPQVIFQDDKESVAFNN